MKVKTECAHGMFDAHKIERVTKLSTVDGGVESMVLEILCDGGDTMNIERLRWGQPQDVVTFAGHRAWVEVDEPEDS